MGQLGAKPPILHHCSVAVLNRVCYLAANLCQSHQGKAGAGADYSEPEGQGSCRGKLVLCSNVLHFQPATHRYNLVQYRPQTRYGRLCQLLQRLGAGLPQV